MRHSREHLIYLLTEAAEVEHNIVFVSLRCIQHEAGR
jgi:hypothetical protein